MSRISKRSGHGIETLGRNFVYHVFTDAINIFDFYIHKVLPVPLQPARVVDNQHKKDLTQHWCAGPS